MTKRLGFRMTITECWLCGPTRKWKSFNKPNTLTLVDLKAFVLCRQPLAQQRMGAVFLHAAPKVC